jgi:hypothetical protein
MMVKAFLGVMIVTALVTWTIDHTSGVLIFLAAVVLFFSIKRRKET